jgi:hypothetical protein
MKQPGGTYVSVGIAARYFAVNVHQTVSVLHVYMGLDFTINGPRDVIIFFFTFNLFYHCISVRQKNYIILTP